MATEIIHRLVDDMDGGEADKTRLLRLDDEIVEIDLSTANGKKLSDFLKPYFEAGRRPKRPGISVRKNISVQPKRDTAQLMAIRKWARANGWPDLSDRGRIPQDAEDAYHAQTGAKKAPAKKAAGGKATSPTFSSAEGS